MTAPNKQDVIDRAAHGHCEGSCERHSGAVRAVHVTDKKTGHNWGFFSYCEEAVKEDEHRGFSVLPAHPAAQQEEG